MLQSLDLGIQGIGAELDRLLPIMERIVDVARRNAKGEKVTKFFVWRHFPTIPCRFWIINGTIIVIKDEISTKTI